MPKSTDIDIIQAFVDSLPDPHELKPQPETFWRDQLRIRYDQVINTRLRDVNHVRKHLNNAGKGFLQALCLWVGLPVNLTTATNAELAEKLCGAITADDRQIWCQDLFLMIELLQGKSPEAIPAIGRTLLPKQTVALIDSGVFTPSGRRLAYAMQVYYQDPQDLFRLMLLEYAERANYRRYTLVPDDESEQAEQTIWEGKEPSALSKAVVDQALQEFETRHKGRRQSTCVGILPEPEKEDSTLVFIYRTLREAHIPEVERTIFGDAAETIVLRFRNRLRSLEEHSSSRVGASIASITARHLFAAEVAYIEDTDRTTQQSVDNLITTLLDHRDERLRLVEICLPHSPLEGNPLLNIRCDKSKSLAPTIHFLDEKGIPLLKQKELGDGEYIGLAFDLTVGGKSRSYIFKIRFEPADPPGSFFVRYTCGRFPRYIRNQFERYLWEKYHVKSLPAIG